MSLRLQIYSIIFSFFFGVFFGIFVKLCYKFLFLISMRKRILFNFFFFFIMALIYFFSIKYINNGILHPHFLFLIFIGWIVEDKIFNVKKK